MSSGTTNALANATSPYLRSAMHQPIEWHEWGAEAFERAHREDKPILLDVGAVWCHWCHVMDRESYENAETAELINHFFVAIKVDRDERPDVDTRYQAAVSAISGQGGWPLTAFLTPDGKPFFGGTYFPPEDRYGRPSFSRVIQTMATAFRDRRDEVLESAGSIMQAIEFNESFSGRSGDIGMPLVEKLAGSMLKQFDPQHGGFGSQPKFPHPAALDFLIDLSTRPGEIAQLSRTAAGITLQKMARGGMRDHLGGGFHRYSVDERWVVPHFEKMAYDNATLLRTYVHGFQSFVDQEFAQTARETMRWMDIVLSDRQNGGFYGSQDADLNLDDDGDYFTWTRDEAAAVLTPEELAVAELHFDIGEIGDMHHNPARNVLHVKLSLDDIARRIGISVIDAEHLLKTATEKLRIAREQRPTPFVDKTIYTGWNGLCISAYFEAGRALMEPDACAFAVHSLDRILEQAWSAETGLAHVVNASPTRVAGVLDDYAFVGLACLDAWEATGRRSYLDTAESIANRLLERFHDKTSGGFFDTETTDQPQLGALSARRKPLQDAPTPAGNSAAAILLLRLADWTGRQELRQVAIETLETFAGIVEHFGLYAATFGLSLMHLLTPPVQVVIVGDDEIADELEATALARYAVNKSIIRLRRNQLNNLPSSLAETVPNLPTGTSVALICGEGRCLPPVHDPEALVVALNEAL
ncbi:MAG: thioredoxin domain-containing protein [Acidobacteria bacterium]|nr:thioredoxin domain-containing protein [Acidobacteriota bacterium]